MNPRTLGSVVLFALLVPIAVVFAQTPAFSEGRADRETIEAWLETLPGEFRAGADYWAGQRSLGKPGSCFNPDGTSRGSWTAGCLAAQRRFAPTDARRKAEPDYRAGWNSVQLVNNQSAAPKPAAPQNDPKPAVDLQACRAIASAVTRLDCYDNLASVTAAQPIPSRPTNAYIPSSPPQSPAPAVFGLRDISSLRRSFEDDPDRFAEQVLGRAKFSAKGRFARFEKAPIQQNLWMVSVLANGPGRAQISCFYDHFDSVVAKILPDAPITIDGTVAMPLDTVFMLSGNCRVAPE